MKQKTKDKIRSVVKKGVVETRAAAGKVSRFSKKAIKTVKKSVPSQQKINSASRTAARILTKEALVAREQAKKTAKRISKFSREVTASVKLGIKDAKKKQNSRT